MGDNYRGNDPAEGRRYAGITRRNETSPGQGYQNQPPTREIDDKLDRESRSPNGQGRR